MSKVIKHQLTTDPKGIEYLKGNPILKKFLDEVNKEISEYYILHLANLTPELLTFEVGSKYIRIWKGKSCWGFISRVDGMLKGAPIKKGDLLAAASWKSPAKHSRGNIIDGSAKWDVYGVQYLK